MSDGFRGVTTVVRGIPFAREQRVSFLTGQITLTAYGYREPLQIDAQ